MPFVLDASVALAWLLRDERNEYADRVAPARRGHGAGSTIWMLEVANGLLSAERRGRLTSAETAQIFGTLADLPIEGRHFALDQALGIVLDLAR